MNNNTRADFDRLLMPVLDGDAPAEQRAEFDAIIREYPTLRAEYEAHRAVEASLRRFAHRAPTPDAFAPIAGTWNRRSLRRIVLAGAVAAAAVLAASVTAVIFLRGEPPCSPEVVYNQLVADGLRPVWVCGDNTEFAAYTQRLKGEPLIVARQDPLTEYVGWTYPSTDTCTPMQPSTLVLMARHERRPIVVFVEDARLDQDYALPEDSLLHLHRAKIGKVVLYEVSPFDKPIVTGQLDSLHSPPPP